MKKCITNLPVTALAMTGLALVCMPTTAAPIPVSSYVYQDQPKPGNATLGDDSNVKLTDGNLGATSGWSSGTYIGWNVQPITTHVTFDLGSVVDVGTVDVYGETAYGGGASQPDSVTVSVSSDDVTYSAPVPVTMTFATDSGSRSLATLDVSAFADARYYRLTFTNSDTNWMMLGEVAFADLSVDSTPPTLASSDIVDDKSGGPVAANTPMVYTVTFSEDMDASTVEASDFEDKDGDVSITIGTITENSLGVFTVQVTPTSAGTLQLQVPIGAVLKDAAGNDLVTTSAIVDDTAITITPPDVTPPTLASSDIVDNKSGGPVAANMPMVYTVTFSEDMDEATVTADDFENAGTSSVSILSVSETSPGVFSVQVQPTDAGTLRLAVKSGAVLNDAAPIPNALNTGSAIEDDTTITVDPEIGVISGGASYTYDPAGVQPVGQSSLLDAGNLKLTDGVFPISGWSDGTNVGFKDGTTAQKAVGKPSVTFDLGAQYDLSTIDVWTEDQYSAAGTESVTISSSTDGVTFSPTTVADPLNWVDQGATYGNKVSIDVSALPTGQYIKMVFVEPSQWMMLTEIEMRGVISGGGDTTPPAWAATYPQVDTLTATGATARAQIDEAGTAYFVVVADGAAAPSAAQVKAGNDAGDSAALASGSIALAAGTENTAAISGLTAGTAYDVYFVAEDGAPNLQVTPVKVDITTLTLFAAWGGGAGFDVDTNGDGVNNGLAFLLGASDPNADATGLLPTVSESGGDLVLTFSMLNAANRGSASLATQHSSDLGATDAWDAAGNQETVPEGPGLGIVVGVVSFDVTANGTLNDVVATIPGSEGSAGKLFGRLLGTE